MVKTIVYREPEWSDEDRARVLALRAYDDSIDQDTNVPLTAAYNPKQAFMVHSTKNHAKAAKERVMRADREKHKDDKPGLDGSLWDDGLRYWVEPVDTPPEALVPVQVQARRRARQARRAREQVTEDAD
jgi:hypothetical protein